MEPAEAATRRPHTAASKEPAPPPDTELPNKTLDTLLPPHRQPDKAPPPQNLYTNPQHRITFRRTHRKHEPLLLPPPLLKRFRAPEAGRSLTPHIFTPTEPGELPFTSDDIMKVVDRGHKDWWRGQLRGWTGVFTTSYVEPLPEPFPGDRAKEAEAKAVDVERLVVMLKNYQERERGGQPENCAWSRCDEEIQELYRACMALRPKIVFNR